MRELTWLSIVGIGEDGWSGLGAGAREAVERAEVIVGGRRHLDLVPQTGAQRIPWPSPMEPFVHELIATYRERSAHVCVLASGDPMLYGVGATFARLLPASAYRVFPQVSAFSLACARLGWPAAEVALLSAVARPLERLLLFVQPKRRVIVYSQDGSTPAATAALLAQHGYGRSLMHVFERLGGERETMREGQASSWDLPHCDDLNVIAIACAADAQAQPLAVVPGLPDDAYENDGQLTKREVRAATLARLSPFPGELLWDVGAGTGTIGIEWMRSHPSCRCIAFEPNAERAERIARNARRLGVPTLQVVAERAPAALEGLAGVGAAEFAGAPDAVFVGGGITTPGVLEACWEALRSGGRLVANAVTVEGEAVLVAWQSRYGGELVRLSISRLEEIGSLHTWRPQLPITQWAVSKR